jgi:hypothetical protein
MNSDVEVDHQLVERHKGFVVLGLLDLKPPQGDGQRVWVQGELGEAHLAIEGLRNGFKKVRLHDGRDDKEANDREENEKDSSANDPFFKSAHGVLRWRSCSGAVA